MELSAEQLAQFERDGYLVVDDLFNAAEVAAMKAAAAAVYGEDRMEIQREKDGRTPRTAASEPGQNMVVELNLYLRPISAYLRASSYRFSFLYMRARPRYTAGNL